VQQHASAKRTARLRLVLTKTDNSFQKIEETTKRQQRVNNLQGGAVTGLEFAVRQTFAYYSDSDAFRKPKVAAGAG
jgi:hypothetical protein